MGAALSLPPELEFRAMRDADRAYVASTWIRSFSAAKNVPTQWRIGHGRVVDRLLDACPVVCAASRIDDDVIFGWLCHRDNVLHYVYVLASARGRGVAKALIDKVFPLAPSAILASHAWPGPSGKFHVNPYLVGV